jgi:hypothetical protein
MRSKIIFPIQKGLRRKHSNMSAYILKRDKNLYEIIEAG